MIFFRAMILIAGLGVSCFSWAQATHYDKPVLIVHSPDTRDCVFFQLSGVTVADPVTPGVPWFALPKTHLGYKEIVSMLLMARVTGKTITVATSGGLACGHAEILNASY